MYHPFAAVKRHRTRSTEPGPVRAEGEGFEPSIRQTTDNGFRDGSSSAQPCGLSPLRDSSRDTSAVGRRTCPQIAQNPTEPAQRSNVR